MIPCVGLVLHEPKIGPNLRAPVSQKLPVSLSFTSIVQLSSSGGMLPLKGEGGGCEGGASVFRTAGLHNRIQLRPLPPQTLAQAPFPRN